MNEEILQLGRQRYLTAIDYDNREKDKEGFLVLKPTAERIDHTHSKLTTDINSLESKLKEYRKEQMKLEEYQETDEYKDSKSKKKKKKAKKAKAALLEMVFNNADSENSEDDIDEEDEENYKDNRKNKNVKKDTLDTTYGKRFSPIVALFYDSITEFDGLANDIQEELNTSVGKSKSMYRSAQIGNLIAAKKSKLDAIKELSGVAKTVSDLEYKKDKDKTASEVGGTEKAIAKLGAKYLKSGIITEDKKKKKDKKNKEYALSGSSKDEDDDDEDDDKNDESQLALAQELRDSLMKHKSDIKLSPHERYISMEGKYKLVVVADAFDPENTWKFIAVDKNGKEIKGFKDDYEGLVPKRKECKMIFDMERLKCTEKNTKRSYQLVIND